MLLNFLSTCAAVEVTLEYKVSRNKMHLTCSTNGWKLLPGPMEFNLEGGKILSTNLDAKLLSSNQLALSLQIITRLQSSSKDYYQVHLWQEETEWIAQSWLRDGAASIFLPSPLHSSKTMQSKSLVEYLNYIEHMLIRSRVDKLAARYNNTVSFNIYGVNSALRVPIGGWLYSLKEEQMYAFNAIVSTVPEEMNTSVSTSGVYSKEKEDLTLTIKKSTINIPRFGDVTVKDEENYGTIREALDTDQNAVDGILGISKVEMFRYEENATEPSFTSNNDVIKGVQNNLDIRKALNDLPEIIPDSYFFQNRQIPFTKHKYKIIKERIEANDFHEQQKLDEKIRKEREAEILKLKEAEEKTEVPVVPEEPFVPEEPELDKIPTPESEVVTPESDEVVPVPDLSPIQVPELKTVKPDTEDVIKTEPMATEQPVAKSEIDDMKSTEIGEEPSKNYMYWAFLGFGSLAILLSVVYLLYVAVKKRREV